MVDRIIIRHCKQCCSLWLCPTAFQYTYGLVCLGYAGNVYSISLPGALCDCDTCFSFFFQIQVELAMLSCQSLRSLREKITCISDAAVLGDFSEDPDRISDQRAVVRLWWCIYMLFFPPTCEQKACHYCSGFSYSTSIWWTAQCIVQISEPGPSFTNAVSFVLRLHTTRISQCILFNTTLELALFGCIRPLRHKTLYFINTTLECSTCSFVQIKSETHMICSYVEKQKVCIFSAMEQQRSPCFDKTVTAFLKHHPLAKKRKRIHFFPSIIAAGDKYFWMKQVSTAP